MNIPTTPLQALEAFIISKAPKHHGTATAPDDWEGLQAWARGHILGVDSLPVSNENTAHTIYSRPAVNLAFRAWHDALHIHYRLDVSHAGELAVAELHQDALRGELGRFEKGAADILWADTAGQTEYFSRWGQFPEDQRAFVAAFLFNRHDAVRTHPDRYRVTGSQAAA